MNPPEPGTAEANLHSDLRTELTAAIGDRPSVTLFLPHLEYRGSPASDPHSEATHWQVDILMSIEDDEEWRPAQLTVGFLQLWTLPIDESVAETLDHISADTAEYLQLLSADALSDAVLEQFGDSFFTGLLILDRAYIHPALRGHSLALWAVAQSIRQLTFGAFTVLVTAFPTPTEDRSGMSTAAAAKRLRQHWGGAGLEPIHACPKLVGQSTATNALDDARADLSVTAAMEVTLTVGDLTAL